MSDKLESRLIDIEDALGGSNELPPLGCTDRLDWHLVKIEELIEEGGGGGGGESPRWGKIKGTLSDQADLQEALDGKQATIDSSHKLPASNVSGLAGVATSGSYNDLSNKPSIPTTSDIQSICDSWSRSALEDVAFDGLFSSLKNKPTNVIEAINKVRINSNQFVDITESGNDRIAELPWIPDTSDIEYVVDSYWGEHLYDDVSYYMHQELSNVAFSGDYDDLSNKPDLTIYAIASNLGTAAYANGTAANANTGIDAGNVPVLDSGGKLPTSVLPALAITDTYTASSWAEQSEQPAEKGDVCIRTDEHKSYILKQEPATIQSNWVELESPTTGVQSVNNQTGYVTLTAADVGAVGNVKVLDTTTQASLQTNASEDISGLSKIYLHKISKTGSFNDLLDVPNFVTSSDLSTILNDFVTVNTFNTTLSNLTLDWSKIDNKPNIVNGVTVNGSSVVSAGVAMITVPTNTSDLTNNSGFITTAALSGYATETYCDNAIATAITGAINANY